MPPLDAELLSMLFAGIELPFLYAIDFLSERPVIWKTQREPIYSLLCMSPWLHRT